MVSDTYGTALFLWTAHNFRQLEADIETIYFPFLAKLMKAPPPHYNPFILLKLLLSSEVYN